MIKMLKVKSDRLYIYLGAIFILLAIFFENRALTIGYCLGLGFVYIVRSEKKNSLKKILVTSFSFFVFMVILAVVFKTDSSRGRIFIYKLSFGILKDSFPGGVGMNNFDVAYGNRQIDYFRSGTYTSKEFLLADNIKHVYNDYLEILIEYGLFGAFIILLWFFAIAFLIIGALGSPYSNNRVLILAIIQLIALTVASLFTFIIYQVHWQFVILGSLVVIIYYGSFSYRDCFLAITAIVLLYTVMYHYAKGVIYWQDYTRAEEAKQYSVAGYDDDADEIYREIFPHLSHDLKFIQNYAYHLIKSGRPQQAELHLEGLLRRDNNSLNQDLLGLCYRRQRKYGLAEAAYLNAIYKVPNRFTSRYKLFLMYISIRQYKKAMELGEFMLTMPVKVPSATIDYYKSFVKQALAEIKTDSDKSNLTPDL